jgi:hypothetical protein
MHATRTAAQDQGRAPLPGEAPTRASGLVAAVRAEATARAAPGPVGQAA